MSRARLDEGVGNEPYHHEGIRPIFDTNCDTHSRGERQTLTESTYPDQFSTALNKKFSTIAF